MKIEINTTEYEFSHGRKPRGFGAWAFYLPGRADPVWATKRDDAGNWITSMTYGDACRTIRAFLKTTYLNPQIFQYGLTIKVGA